MGYLKTARLAWRAASCAFGVPRHPYKLTLAVTDRCDSRCSVCRIWQRKPQTPEVTPEDIARFLSRAPRFGWVDLTGGEPTLREDLSEIAQVAVRSCPSLALLHFPTNGLDPDRVVAQTEKILRTKPARLIVTVSLDGPPEINDALRGVRGSFAAAVETYGALSKLRGCEVYLGTTLSQANARFFPALLESLHPLFPSLGAADVHVNVAHRSGHQYGNEDVSVGDPGTLAEAVEGVLGLRQARVGAVEVLDRFYLRGASSYLRGGGRPVTCQALSASCYVSAQGVVHPCTLYDRPLGTIRDPEFDLSECWRSPRADQVRAEIHEQRCPNCWTPCEAYPAIAADLVRRVFRVRYGPAGWLSPSRSSGRTVEP